MEQGELMYIHRFVYADQDQLGLHEKWNGKVRVLATKQDKIVSMVKDLRRDLDQNLDKKLEANFKVLNKKLEE